MYNIKEIYFPGNCAFYRSLENRTSVDRKGPGGAVFTQLAPPQVRAMIAALIFQSEKGDLNSFFEKVSEARMAFGGYAVVPQVEFNQGASGYYIDLNFLRILPQAEYVECNERKEPMEILGEVCERHYLPAPRRYVLMGKSMHCHYGVIQENPSMTDFDCWNAQVSVGDESTIGLVRIRFRQPTPPMPGVMPESSGEEPGGISSLVAERSFFPVGDCPVNRLP